MGRGREARGTGGGSKRHTDTGEVVASGTQTQGEAQGRQTETQTQTQGEQQQEAHRHRGSSSKRHTDTDGGSSKQHEAHNIMNTQTFSSGTSREPVSSLTAASDISCCSVDITSCSTSCSFGSCSAAELSWPTLSMVLVASTDNCGSPFSLLYGYRTVVVTLA